MTIRKNKERQGDQRPAISRNKRKSSNKHRFEEYWKQEKVQKEIEEKQLYQGVLRINSKNRSEAYVTVDDFDLDIFIEGEINRNRALEGDIVAIKLLDKSKWQQRRVASNSNDDEYENNSELTDSIESITVDDISKLCLSEDTKQDTDTNETPQDNEHYYTDPNLHQDNEDNFGMFSDDEESEMDYDFQTKNDVDEETHYYDELQQQQQQQNEQQKQEVEKDEIKSLDNNNSVYTLQPSGKVVAIIKEQHQKEHVGLLRTSHRGDIIKEKDRFAVVIPVDKRWPRILVPLSECPPGFANDPKSFKNHLFIVKLQKWSASARMPLGRIKRMIGPTGDLTAETESLLVENGINTQDFSSRVLKCVRKYQGKPWRIPRSEFQKRRDLRKKRIFTIDPATAKDLDDALSITPLSNGRYEVGVHIADVSFFVEQGSALDYEARKRATSVYLVQRLVPMLPHILSENVCSLRPNEDRLAFSVFWEMDRDGNIATEEPSWFGKTIVRSCAQLNYDIIQDIINGTIKSKDDLPKEYHATNNQNTNSMIKDVRSMQSMASKLRENRFDNGAMRLQIPKLSFELDDQQVPINMTTKEMKDSNFLVEEFMLVANTLTARMMMNHCPELALLRQHSAPQETKLEQFKSFCAEQGLEIDSSSAGAFYQSLQEIREKTSDFEFATVEFMATKTMQNAKYCLAADNPPDTYHHYALNSPVYTHFTSPIRRYADIVVHRILAQIAKQREQQANNNRRKKPQHRNRAKQYGKKKDKHKKSPKNSPPASPTTLYDQDTLHKIIENCNEKRHAAKKAQEQSISLFAGAYLAQHPVQEEGIILDTGRKSADILVPKLGLQARVHLGKLQPIPENSAIRLRWPDNSTFTIEPRKQVRVSVSQHPHTTGRLDIQLARPELQPV